MFIARKGERGMISWGFRVARVPSFSILTTNQGTNVQGISTVTTGCLISTEWPVSLRGLIDAMPVVGPEQGAESLESDEPSRIRTPRT